MSPIEICNLLHVWVSCLDGCCLLSACSQTHNQIQFKELEIQQSSKAKKHHFQYTNHQVFLKCLRKHLFKTYAKWRIKTSIFITATFVILSRLRFLSYLLGVTTVSVMSNPNTIDICTNIHLLRITQMILWELNIRLIWDRVK